MTRLNCVSTREEIDEEPLRLPGNDFIIYVKTTEPPKKLTM